MSRASRTSLATRVTALCLAVATVAVVVTGLVWQPLVTSAARDLARDNLAGQADALAGLLDEEDFEKKRLGIRRLTDQLRTQGIMFGARRPNGNFTGGPRAEQVAQRSLPALGRNESSSSTLVVDGRELLVEARGIGDDVGFALARPVELSDATEDAMLGNVGLAVGIGLGVAALAGLVLARLLSKPLRSTASVARQMRSGRRDLRAEVAGPAEVADVAASVNELAGALQHSESRQREFLLSVSHELRTPLTAVKGFAESLADGVVDGDDVRRVGRTMSDEADRLDRLVTDLLELARLGADEFHLDMTEVELNDFLRECGDVWRVRCAGEGVEFRLEPADHSVVARADPRRLRQVVDILADNALRVLPAGAPLVLALKTDPAGALLQVRDGGPGLSEEDYRMAFERGALRARYRGRRPVGSGVGLALAHALVTRMGGGLQAGPAPEGGAAFTIGLPRTE